MKVEEQEIFHSGECSMCKGPKEEGRGCLKICSSVATEELPFLLMRRVGART